MAKKNLYNPYILGSLAVLVLLIFGTTIWFKNTSTPKPKIKIGVITDLTGPASEYWGIPTKIGAELAKQDLAQQNIDLELVVEDYQLDAPKALNAAQKLENTDAVDAFYVEFNPGIYSTVSFLKDKQKLVVYDAAPTSPLQASPNLFKTYLDYKKGCADIATKFKTDGITKIGSLKANLEFADLCQEGIREVFGSEVVTQDYTLGETDFKTSLLKIKDSGAQAVINTVFEAETLNTLKGIKEQNLGLKFGGVTDSITPNVVQNYANELKGGYSFGFRDVESSFAARIKEKDPKVNTLYGAALSYLHITQMAKALNSCEKKIECVNAKMAENKADEVTGFQGFVNRIAVFKTEIKKY